MCMWGLSVSRTYSGEYMEILWSYYFVPRSTRAQEKGQQEELRGNARDASLRRCNDMDSVFAQLST